MSDAHIEVTEIEVSAEHYRIRARKKQWADRWIIDDPSTGAFAVLASIEEAQSALGRFCEAGERLVVARQAAAVIEDEIRSLTDMTSAGLRNGETS